MPIRHQIRRAKGFRYPAGAKKVDRSTGFGNPFVVGVHGTRADCVRWHGRLVLDGFVTATSREHMEAQRQHLHYVKANIDKLIGKDVACFCPLDAACHGDNLLTLAARYSCEEVKP